MPSGWSTRDHACSVHVLADNIKDYRMHNNLVQLVDGKLELDGKLESHLLIAAFGCTIRSCFGLGFWRTYSNIFCLARFWGIFYFIQKAYIL